jgi:hypothetical protein
MQDKHGSCLVTQSYGTNFWLGIMVVSCKPSSLCLWEVKLTKLQPLRALEGGGSVAEQCCKIFLGGAVACFYQINFFRDVRYGNDLSKGVELQVMQMQFDVLPRSPKILVLPSQSAQ